MSGDGPGFDEFFARTPAYTPPRRRWGRALIIWVVVLAVLTGGAVLADGAARSAAEDAVQAEIAKKLPTGAGPITAEIGGFSFFQQFFAGSLENIAVSFELDNDALPALAESQGFPGPVTVAAGQLSLEGGTQLLGREVGYVLSVDPQLVEGGVQLVPTGIVARVGDQEMDVSGMLDIATLSATLCTASLMPEQLVLTGIHVGDNSIRFDVTGTDVPFDLNRLRGRGSCE